MAHVTNSLRSSQTLSRRRPILVQVLASGRAAASSFSLPIVFDGPARVDGLTSRYSLSDVVLLPRGHSGIQRSLVYWKAQRAGAALIAAAQPRVARCHCDVRSWSTAHVTAGVVSISAGPSHGARAPARTRFASPRHCTGSGWLCCRADVKLIGSHCRRDSRASSVSPPTSPAGSTDWLKGAAPGGLPGIAAQPVGVPERQRVLVSPTPLLGRVKTRVCRNAGCW